jgi:hypothetical protein
MSTKTFEKKCSELTSLRKERDECVKIFLARNKLIIGSYCELLVKCGRSNCHCQEKPCHLVSRLGIKDNGLIKNKVIRVNDRENVKGLVENYRDHKKMLAEIVKLQKKEIKIIRKIIEAKSKKYE